jgi:tripartite-type tricarboxylate transporter receptor subunit TctC
MRRLILCASVVLGVLLPGLARAAWPERPVTIVTPFAAGGIADVVARMTALRLQESLKQTFIVENQPGGAGVIAAERVIKSPPDGYTLMSTPVFQITMAQYTHNVTFDGARDFTPISAVAAAPFVITVGSSFPGNTQADFIAYVKANPGKVNYASAGVGTPQHVAGELFKMMTGLSIEHVPYRGSAPALNDLLGGQVQMMIETTPASLGHLREGRFRGLAVTTKTRAEALPDLPTVNDFVPGYEAISWYGISAPKNTPADVVNTLNREINAALADPKMKARLADLGGTVLPGTPAEFGKFIADEADKWGKVVEAAHMKVE